MGLYRRGDIWWVAFYTPAGRVVQSTGTANRKDADTIYQELKRRSLAQRHGVALQARKLTLADLAAEFLSRTGSNKYHVERLKSLLPHLGGLQVSTITRGAVEQYRTARIAHVRNATANRDIAVLKHIMYWALDEGLIGHNPLTRFRRLPEPKRPRRVLSVVEEDRLLDVALPHLKQAIVLAVDTGMRRGELLTLKREYLDPYRKVLVVSQSKTAGGTGREIPWSSRVEALLRPLAGGEGPVVLYRNDSLKNLKHAWQSAVRRSGVPHIRFHDLRHTFNTRLMEAGITQDVRKALMGHADSDINDTYTHVELPATRAAIAALDRWRVQQHADINRHATDHEGGHHGTLATENAEGDAGSATRTALHQD